MSLLLSLVLLVLVLALVCWIIQVVPGIPEQFKPILMLVAVIVGILALFGGGVWHW